MRPRQVRTRIICDVQTTSSQQEAPPGDVTHLSQLFLRKQRRHHGTSNQVPKQTSSLIQASCSVPSIARKITGLPAKPTVRSAQYIFTSLVHTQFTVLIRTPQPYTCDAPICPMNPSSDSLQFWLKETRLCVVVRARSHQKQRFTRGESIAFEVCSPHGEG